MRLIPITIALGIICGIGGCSGKGPIKPMSDEQQQPKEVLTSAGTEPEETTSEVGDTNSELCDTVPDNESAASQDPFVFVVGMNFDTTAAEWISGDVIECPAPNGKLVRMKLYGVAAPRPGQPYFDKAGTG